MRKYPPHCPRPSTNSPIHPRADSTLQPAAAGAPPSPRSTIQRPSLTKLPLCLLACLPACPPPPRPFKVRADAFLRANRLPSFSSYRFPSFLLFLFTLPNNIKVPKNIFKQKFKKMERNLQIIKVSVVDKTNVFLSKEIFLFIVIIENYRIFERLR